MINEQDMLETAKRFGYTKDEWSWIFQDWANSAYSIIITTAIFPLFYKAIASGAGVSDVNSTAYLGYSNSIATASVALLAPILGSIADFRNFRKPMFTISTLLGIFTISIMAFIPASTSNITWIMLLVLYIFSSIGFSSANVFYDASLLDVTSNNRMSQVSSTGFAMGYIGSTIPFAGVILMILNVDKLPYTTDQITRFSFILTAVWWFVFTIPYWRNVEQLSSIEPKENIIKSSFLKLKETISSVKDNRNIFLFLLAYFLYIDGVGTIIKMATAVGADIGLSSTVMIVVLMIVQVVAFPFTILYGYLSNKFGDKLMIYVGIATYIGICIFALTLETEMDFFILAVLVGTAQGGIQSLSRSMFGKLVPDKKSNEYFGLYNVFGKFSSIIGTSLVGIIGQATNNTLNGVFALIVLFTVGGLLLLPVKEQVLTT
ncbi:MAG TPA: MFS transporter [Atopostipes sp.]|nr:MFS transporter [Atopostipes sp.]